MKNYLLLFSLSAFLNTSHAQNYIKIHAGAEIPTTFFAEAYKTGWGIYATDYYQIGKGGSIVFSTGVAAWNVIEESNGKTGMVLTRFGYRQFLVADIYFQGDAGFGVGLENFTGTTRFAYGFGPGYLFKNKRGGGIDINARFNRAFNRSWFGLGAGYQFKL